MHPRTVSYNSSIPSPSGTGVALETVGLFDAPNIHPFVKDAFHCWGDGSGGMSHADELWDEADGFFYDLLRLPDGHSVRLKVRLLVGLISLLATTVLAAWMLERLPVFRQQIAEFQQNHPHLFANVADPTQPGVNGRRLIAIVNETKLRH